MIDLATLIRDDWPPGGWPPEFGPEHKAVLALTAVLAALLVELELKPTPNLTAALRVLADTGDGPDPAASEAKLKSFVERLNRSVLLWTPAAEEGKQHES